MKWYKIFEDGIANPKTLFHGVNGSRILPLNTWVKAKMGIGSEGKGPKYRTGFHVLGNFEEIKSYAKKFKLKNRVIVEVKVDKYSKLWLKKKSRHQVFLAEKIKIMERHWNKKIPI